MKDLNSKKGILLLSHQGFSFVEDLAAQIRTFDLEVYILSSCLASSSRARRATLLTLGNWTKIIAESPSLSPGDVDVALDELRQSGHHVVAAISVWDGYRGLMARLNHQLGAFDLALDTVALVNDKLALRQQLKNVGLSSVNARTATGLLLDELRGSSGRYFVKPRRGLASFATFEFTDALRWSEIEVLRQMMEADEEYRHVFAEHPEFIIEDYIEGREISFEIIASKGEIFVLGAHEKVGIEACGHTMLETVCVSPPPGITSGELSTGLDFVRRVLVSLGAVTGCFHVELRMAADGTWEVIEVNPRVGGAYITQSVKVLTGGSCLLRLWIASLLGYHTDLRNLEVQALARPWKTTVFRVFFGQAGRKIARISPASFEPKPALVRVIAQEGDELPDAAREIFVGQMLWTSVAAPDSPEVALLVARSRDALEVNYV